VDWSSDVCSSDLCRGNPLLTTDFGNCAYRYSAATDLLPQSSEASGMVSFTKALPANNTLQFQYFYAQSKVEGWSGPMFYALPIAANNPFIPAASRLTCLGTCSAAPDVVDGGLAVWSAPLKNRHTATVTNTDA